MTGILIDVLMYGIMLVQLFYVFTGNTVHEILGITLFLCMIVHIWIKRKRIRAIFRKGSNKNLAVSLSEAVIILLIVCMIIMAVSSMGVSKLLFPGFTFLGDPSFHRLLAVVILVLSVIHGGFHVYLRTKKKKLTAAGIAVCSVLCLVLGLWMVPYLNRHFRTVEVDYNEVVSGDKVEWAGEKPLVVYFTRVGNTDFEEDIDAVSGASLLLGSGKLMGNTQLLSDMICDAVGCEASAITLTGARYPSSYYDTIAVSRTEISEGRLPEILPIDTEHCKTVILVYPIWWGTIPSPVATFLSRNDFAGKRIYLLATQGSSGFVKSTEDIKKLVPDAEVTEGLSIYCDDIPKVRKEITEWLEAVSRMEQNR